MLFVAYCNYNTASHLARVYSTSLLSAHQKILLQKLAGKHLLTQIFECCNIDTTLIQKITVDEQGKPQIPDSGIFFNISHSGNIVTAIVSDQQEVGIDIEKIRPISLTAFDHFFSEKEWDTIINAKAPSEALLSLWTIKEAVLKCIGTGFNPFAPEIEILNEKTVLDKEGQPYHYRSQCIDQEYILTYASTKELESAVQIQNFNFSMNEI